MPLYTTFALCKDSDACIDSYKKFAKHKGGITKFGKNTPFDLLEVLDVMGLDDTIWCFDCLISEDQEKSKKIVGMFCCDIAEHVLQYFESQYPDDKRIRTCIDITRKYLNGKATINELQAAESARSAAWSATWSAGSATWSARSAAESAGSAAESAGSAWSVRSAAMSAARSARSAAESAGSAAESAWSAAWSAAELNWQVERLRYYLRLEDTP